MEKINNNITEDFCSLEVSRLLEKKGCKLCTRQIHVAEDYAMYYSCTHALAIEWLRVNFGIWIMIDPDMDNNRCWFQIVSKEYVGDGNTYFFNTPQEAIEAALLYVLKNLI